MHSALPRLVSTAKRSRSHMRAHASRKRQATPLGTARHPVRTCRQPPTKDGFHGDGCSNAPLRDRRAGRWRIRQGELRGGVRLTTERPTGGVGTRFVTSGSEACHSGLLENSRRASFAEGAEALLVGCRQAPWHASGCTVCQSGECGGHVQPRSAKASAINRGWTERPLEVRVSRR
ncbi:hypothetical protein AAFF_G00183090 [Aldrovandia affinis]|uniref:Uncharacterized protein n=1 Tax=Aldrovandia affinis TaxID=143900 RepID=A0AAD7W7I2_9TELE|nr:hypothetical protein AAFF_G00183090 [Aldrovandia affinis]